MNAPVQESAEKVEDPSTGATKATAMQKSPPQSESADTKSDTKNNGSTAKKIDKYNKKLEQEKQAIKKTEEELSQVHAKITDLNSALEENTKLREKEYERFVKIMQNHYGVSDEATAQKSLQQCFENHNVPNNPAAELFKIKAVHTKIQTDMKKLEDTSKTLRELREKQRQKIVHMGHEKKDLELSK